MAYRGEYGELYLTALPGDQDYMIPRDFCGTLGDAQEHICKAFRDNHNTRKRLLQEVYLFFDGDVVDSFDYYSNGEANTVSNRVDVNLREYILQYILGHLDENSGGFRVREVWRDYCDVARSRKAPHHKNGVCYRSMTWAFRGLVRDGLLAVFDRHSNRGNNVDSNFQDRQSNSARFPGFHRGGRINQ